MNTATFIELTETMDSVLANRILSWRADGFLTSVHKMTVADMKEMLHGYLRSYRTMKRAELVDLLNAAYCLVCADSALAYAQSGNDDAIAKPALSAISERHLTTAIVESILPPNFLQCNFIKPSREIMYVITNYLSAKYKDAPVVSESVDEPVVSESVDEPVVSESVDEPVVSESVDDALVAALSQRLGVDASQVPTSWLTYLPLAEKQELVGFLTPKETSASVDTDTPAFEPLPADDTPAFEPLPAESDDLDVISNFLVSTLKESDPDTVSGEELVIALSLATNLSPNQIITWDLIEGDYLTRRNVLAAQLGITCQDIKDAHSVLKLKGWALTYSPDVDSLKVGRLVKHVTRFFGIRNRIRLTGKSLALSEWRKVLPLLDAPQSSSPIVDAPQSSSPIVDALPVADTVADNALYDFPGSDGKGIRVKIAPYQQHALIVSASPYSQSETAKPFTPMFYCANSESELALALDKVKVSYQDYLTAPAVTQ